MIDFTGCKVLVNSYEGADFKRKIIYDGDVYMLKFGQKLESDEHKPLQASYTSTPVSEYLGSHIYALAGLPTQHTVMGTYDGRSVVACRDFIESRPDAKNVTLVEFKKLENSFLGSSTAGGRTPILGNLLGIFSEHDSLEGIREAAEERYWQMFAVDSLIGNFDRHAGNWGYILDKGRNEIIDLAPIYDCGSSLYPALNEAAMADFIKDRDSLVKRVLDFPRAALRIGKNKIAYHEFLLSDVGAKARAVLGGIMRELDFAAIHRLIEDTPCISDVRREFYSQLIDVRREAILEPAYELYREERRHEKAIESPVSLKEEAKNAKEASKAMEQTAPPAERERDGNR